MTCFMQTQQLSDILVKSQSVELLLFLFSKIREKQRKQQERRKKLVEAAALLKEKNADG